ncbi:MAG: hypothetical protein ACOYBW_00610 [Fluviibacter phosphoraccumulans]
MKQRPKNLQQSSSNKAYRSPSQLANPLGMRTRVTRHIAGFAVLFGFFILSGVFESGKGGTLSDWSVVIYVILALIAYAFGFYVYPIVNRAWQDSKS